MIIFVRFELGSAHGLAPLVELKQMIKGIVESPYTETPPKSQRVTMRTIGFTE